MNSRKRRTMIKGKGRRGTAKRHPRSLTRTRATKAKKGSARIRGPRTPKRPQIEARRTGEAARNRVKSRGVNRTRTKTLKAYIRRVRGRKPKRVLSEWFAVRVKQGRERYAAMNVRKRGGTPFVPYVLHEGKYREQPLFPGYIFVLGPQWYYLQVTPGCLYPIMMGDSPACMPLKEMRALHKSCDKEGVILIPREKFTKGQRVRFRKGAWQGHLGVYIRQSGANRVRVLLSLLGGNHELEFNHSDITAAEQAGDGLEAEARARPVDGASVVAKGGQDGDRNNPS